MKLLRKSGGSHFFDSLRPPAQPGASDVRESLAVFAPAGAGSFHTCGLYLIPKSGEPLFGWYEALTSGDLP